ncbi:MAG: glycosyltransferase family 2 protein [Sulfuricaulis sp.]|uniref:glycosyltransferase family 2 protein n=1 Tax=Sulfuricaulis sp. TaxID=2003553 RepID=UPI0025FB5FD5|nr:glycosyltransferase family 2 protein [Sulfuricaulis sp.]MCR4346531.1 glycosyltransferase family 2 protein [Sulfuricaulis sp.]
MAQAIFFISAALLLYNYLLFPAGIILMARMGGSKVAETLSTASESLPTVTLVIAAYNEERVIEAKILNSLDLDYPVELLRILVVSDGSTDSTPQIVQRFQNKGVLSLHDPERRGKTAALNRAVASATSDIVVFSDANNIFDKNALRQLVKHFANPRVGGVCGLKQIYHSAERESSQGDSLYWKYESAIKESESRLGSITNADGEIFAVRRSLYQPVDNMLINDDAEITFILIKQGYRVLYERHAVSHEQASIRIEDDFHVKVRMISGGFQTIARHWAFLLPPRSWFAFNFVSHKLLRWLAPEFMILIAISSLWLISSPFFLAMIILQGAFYALAVLGWITREGIGRRAVFYIPFYLCAMNLAALHGLWRFLAGTQTTQWRKAER